MHSLGLREPVAARVVEAGAHKVGRWEAARAPAGVGLDAPQHAAVQACAPKVQLSLRVYGP